MLDHLDVRRTEMNALKKMTINERRNAPRHDVALYTAFPPDDPFWLSLMVFMDNAWFHRVWTLQEMSLTQKAVVLCDILCDNGVIDFGLVLRIRRILFDLAMRGIFWAESHVREFEKQGRYFTQFEMSCSYSLTMNIQAVGGIPALSLLL